jgi:hypothetical protein
MLLKQLLETVIEHSELDELKTQFPQYPDLDGHSSQDTIDYDSRTSFFNRGNDPHDRYEPNIRHYRQSPESALAIIGSSYTMNGFLRHVAQKKNPIDF